MISDFGACGGSERPPSGPGQRVPAATKRRLGNVTSGQESPQRGLAPAPWPRARAPLPGPPRPQPPTGVGFPAQKGLKGSQNHDPARVSVGPARPEPPDPQKEGATPRPRAVQSRCEAGVTCRGQRHRHVLRRGRLGWSPAPTGNPVCHPRAPQAPDARHPPPPAPGVGGLKGRKARDTRGHPGTPAHLSRGSRLGLRHRLRTLA